MNAIPGLRQFVSLVSKGGTPIMLADAFGNPYPTTGHGALVFNEGPELSDPTLSGVVIVEDAIHLASGSAANPSLTFGDVPYNFGMYEAGISVGGVPILTFQPDGISVTGNITYSGQLSGAFHTPMTTRGDLYYMGASGPSRLGIGPAGTTPVSNGVDLTYQPAATGNVTSIDGVPGETVADPSPISTVGTIGLADTAVTPGVYGDITNIPQLLVDQKGRLLGVANIPFTSGGSMTSVTPGTGLTSTPNPIVTAGTIALTDTAVSPAVYGSGSQIPQITVDQQGRITLATNIAVSIPPAGVTSISTAGGSGITLTPSPIVSTGTIAVDTTVIATVVSQGNYLLRSGGTMTGTITSQPAAPLAASAPALIVNQIWNNAAVGFNALAMNITDTASAATSRLLSLQVGGADRLSLDKFGNVILAGALNATQGTFSGAISSVTATFSDTVVGGSVVLVNNNTNETGFTVPLQIRQGNNAGGTNFSSMLLEQNAVNDMAIEVADQANVKGTLRLQPFGGNVIVGGNAAVTSVDITPPVAPVDRQLWWNSELGQFFIRYNDGNTVQWVAAAPSATSALPVMSGYLYNCGLSNSGSLGIVFGGGQWASNNNAAMVAFNAVTKLLSAVWVAGTGVGGRANAIALTANTTYHCFGITLTSGATDAYFDTSPTGANAPVNTVYKRRLGSVITDATAANILPFLQIGNDFRLITSVLNVSGFPAAGLILVTAPTGINTKWRGNLSLSAQAGQNVAVNLTDFGIADAGGAGQMTYTTGSGGTATITTMATAVEHWTNLASQIGYSAGGVGNSSSITSQGWMDLRGQDGGL